MNTLYPLNEYKLLYQTNVWNKKNNERRAIYYRVQVDLQQDANFLLALPVIWDI